MDIINSPKVHKLKNYKTIFIHENVSKEIVKATKGWGDAKDFEKWLYDRFAQLDYCNSVHLNYPRLFEPIEELFAITYRHRAKNIRILYSLENDTVKILLCAFDEKNTKADYTKAKNTARQRLKQIKGGI